MLIKPRRHVSGRHIDDVIEAYARQIFIASSQRLERRGRAQGGHRSVASSRGDRYSRRAGNGLLEHLVSGRRHATWMLRPSLEVLARTIPAARRPEE